VVEEERRTMADLRPGARWAGSGLAATFLGLILVVALGAVAAAQGVRLTGAITDPENHLGACRQQVLDADRALFDATGTNVFTVLVPGDGTDIGAVADATWGSNESLTDKDVLFVASTGEPHANLIQGAGLDATVSQNEIDGINEAVRTPALAGDWCAATLAVIGGYRTAIAGSSDGGGGGIPGWLLLILAVLVVAGIVLFVWNRRSASPRERALQEDLGKQATSLLIQTDDLLRSTEQEVGFAEAQFGESQAAPYRKALDDAKALLRDAFALSQQLDDETPETPEQRREMLQGVIDRCTQAQQLVNDQAARVKGLRDLVRNIDQVLPQTGALVEAQTARVDGARSILAELGQRYQAENLRAVAGNADAAQQKLAGATAAIAAGEAALTSGDRDAAVSKVQEAETAIAEAKALLDAVDATKADLTSGEAELTASLSAVDQDIAEARSAIAAGKATERASEVDRAAALLASARQLAAATPVDLVGATRAVTEANTAVDAVLAGIQEADAAAQRNAATAHAAFSNASASVAQARGLLSAYGATAAGRRASTRLAQAQEYLARAQSLMATDPAMAAQAAQTADALADEAIAEMQASGVGGQIQWGNEGGGYFGGPSHMPSGGGGGGGGSDMLGSIIGGILGGMLSGGGGGRSSGWNGGRGGFGGFGSGGFGGGSSRGSGRSSGGGGRSGARAGRRSGF
jgi:hypothetical protein